jgi:hypothetical protein
MGSTPHCDGAAPAYVRSMSLMQRLFRREPPPETSCPRCATPVPGGAVECSACGWDMRESYHEAGSTGQSGA